MPVRMCVLIAAATLLYGAVLHLNADDGNQAGQVGDVLRPYVERQQLAGAVVLVADAKQVLAHEAVGYSDVAAKQEMSPDAVFWIASMTKPITCTAMMLLVDEGKVSLDDPIAKHLPEFAGQLYVHEQTEDQLVLKKPKQGVLIRHLLSHTSGMMSGSAIEERADTLPLKTRVAAYSMGPTKFAPGLEFEYNNPGMATAGRIIEVVSGMPYERFLQERLFAPLGMKDTTFVPSQAQLARLAKGYGPNDAGTGLEELPLSFMTQPLSEPSRQPSPGGGLFSTARDLAAFCQMILNHGQHHGRRVVSEQSIRLMTTTQTGFLINLGRGEHGYGYGWWTSRKSQGESGPVLVGEFGHGGAFSTNMTINPDHGLITIYLIQHRGHPGVDGEQLIEEFQQAARARYGKK